MVTKCKTCGASLQFNEERCGYCGTVPGNNGVQPQETQNSLVQENNFNQFNQPMQPVNNSQNEGVPPKTVFAGLGLGFGIGAIVLFWIPFVGLLLGILAVIFVILAKNVKGLRIAALVCSIIGTILSLIITGLVMIGIAFATNFDTAALLQQEMNNRPIIVTEGQHEIVGIWEWDLSGSEWYIFRADGTGVNLSNGDEFKWYEDGTMSGDVGARWEINGGILTIHWGFGGFSYSYRRNN